MSIEKVKKEFEKLGIIDRLMEFPVSSATVELAAEAVGVIPDRICKSLSFKDRSREEGGAIMVCASGEARIDNKKFKETFGQKASMLQTEEVVAYTGHEVGGVCPFAIPEDAPVKIYIDVSLKKYETIFPAGGSSSSAIGLTPQELYDYGKALDWVDVCKDPENAE